MTGYKDQKKLLLAVDCIIFGFDGSHLQILLIKRGFFPEKGKWSLMGGFLEPNETLQNAASRVLQTLTGLTDVYLEELATFSHPRRDLAERTVSVAYFSLIDINKFKTQIKEEYHAQWFHINNYPPLIFDHSEMVEKAKKRLRYKAAFHPILFELLPPKFTLPQLQNLYEEVYQIKFDKRNFSRKILSMNLLEKLNEKDKSQSKKGAWLYQLKKNKYKANFHKVASIIPNPDIHFA